MRKVIFFIVLALISAAEAATIDIRIVSLNGEDIPPTREITITPGDIIEFQVTYNAPTSEYLFALQVTMNVSGPGSIFWAPPYHPDDWPGCDWHVEEEIWFCRDIHPAFDPELCGHGDNWIVAGAMSKGVKGTGTEIWVAKGLFLECNGFGDVYLWLSNYAQGCIVIDVNYNQRPYYYYPGVIIHQVPACWLCPGQPYGDADGNGVVTGNDLLILKRSWLKTVNDPQYNCCADFNHDGIVNIQDLLRLKQGWLTVHFPCDAISCP